MNIIVTGAQGFIGKNLCVMLAEKGYDSVVQIDRDTSEEAIKAALSNADFVFHLAGINRPKDDAEFTIGNADFTEFVVNELKANGRNTPIMLSSSIQANLDNAYGASKAQAEALVAEYGKDTGAGTFIYRFPNVFGKWCRPNYNSFVATFCHNVVNNIDINIHDPSAPVNLVYIDDVCYTLIALLEGSVDSGFKQVPVEYNTTVGKVAELLKAFKESRDTLVTEHVGTGLTRALYSTYLSYFEPSEFHYTLPKYSDNRGMFCEMLKTKESGQFSFFTAHKGITRGGHYHHTKNEKFLVIKGEALFKFEHVITGERYEFTVNSDEATVVETVPGWSHDVTNIGEEELIVMLWANEIFDREAPDTIAKPL
ncbi:NAD-dependent epimerase/dehydratase family protein [Vibrio splendidus]|uniref:Capsular biosynthesis protein n=1 Tax=Vibrio splendidus TaxID=29497 RepID=A0A2N7F9L9_VIBSP|nr:NAD-dependent epimerase/dehydratase family protein [Vibrio splendidus]PMJ64144.1 capsular biosynthesis protein [Vibrio splendidus]